MSSLSEATPITLTADERAELERLARSTKPEHRMCLKAQIVVMAAEGVATRAIGRALGRTTGTASTWRLHYAKDRLASFSDALSGAAPDRDDRADHAIGPKPRRRRT